MKSQLQRRMLVVSIGTILVFNTFTINAEPADQLGRVFLSPAERAELNEQRQEYYSPPEIDFVEETPPEIVEESDTLEEESLGPAILVNGFVKRAGTSGTVWINGESSYDGDMATLNVNHLKTQIIGKKVKVTPLDEQGVVYLKPGEGFNPQSQEFTKSYETIGDLPDAAH